MKRHLIRVRGLDGHWYYVGEEWTMVALAAKARRFFTKADAATAASRITIANPTYQTEIVPA